LMMSLLTFTAPTMRIALFLYRPDTIKSRFIMTRW